MSPSSLHLEWFVHLSIAFRRPIRSRVPQERPKTEHPRSSGLRIAQRVFAGNHWQRLRNRGILLLIYEIPSKSYAIIWHKGNTILPVYHIFSSSQTKTMRIVVVRDIGGLSSRLTSIVKVVLMALDQNCQSNFSMRMWEPDDRPLLVLHWNVN
jgi:hypothetical protein